MKKLLFLVVIFCLGACGNNLGSNGELARQNLLDKGYEIISYEGSEEYSFTRTELRDLPHLSIWAVQPVSPKLYIGSEITQEIFIVKNHPLSKVYVSQRGFSGEVEVRVFINEGKIIGGISYPLGEGTVGWEYSLDGKTAEEIHGEDLDSLLEEWSLGEE